jgi:hypothetical protein
MALQGGISLSGCQPNRQQANVPREEIHALSEALMETQR